MSRRRSVFDSAACVLRRGVVIVLGCSALLAAAEDAPAPIEESLGDRITKEVSGLLERSAGAICRIEANDEHGTLRGTGFFIDGDGTLLTSFGVGGSTDDLVVTVGQEKFPASRRAADARSGLAVLKIEAGEPIPYLRCGKSTDLRVASPVVAVGFPLDLPLSPSFGLIAGFDLTFQGRYFATRHLRANVVVQRGQGGSPVFDLKGDVVGVLISTVEQGSGGFVLPIEAAMKFVRDVQQHGRLRQGWLGADVRLTDAPEFGSRARVRQVRADGPGHKGGLRAGDVLLTIGGRKIVSPEDVLDASFYITADDALKLQVSRAGKPQELTIFPSDPPDGEGPAVEVPTPAVLGANGIGFGSLESR